MIVKDLAQNKTLHYLAGINRGVNPSHVTRIAKSVESMGCTRPVVIAHIDFLPGQPVGQYIIDGQHLFNALQRSGMVVPVTEIKITSLTHLVETIAMLNASSKNWTLMDYVHAWGIVSKHYLELDRLYKIYDLELVTMAAVLSETSIPIDSGGKIVSELMKKGLFTVKNLKNNLILLDHVTDVLKIVPRQHRSENKYVCREFVVFFRQNIQRYDHKKFLRNLEKNKVRVEMTTQEPNKLVQMFETFL